MMKNSILLIAFVGMTLVAAKVAPAQIVNENFDSHAVGTDMHNLDGWEGWYGDAAVGGFVTDEQANSGKHSLRFTRPVDLAPYWESITSGKWIMVMMQYVPSAATGGDAYYGVLHSYEKGTAGSAGWITEVISDFATGDVRISGGDTARLPLVRDAWAEIKAELDFNAQVATFYYNGGLLGTRDATSLSGLDLWANSNDVMYFDDFWLGTVEMYTTLASRPVPEDGAPDVARDVVLRWEPGFFGDRHDVYLGTVFDDVSDADRNNPLSVLVTQGQGDTSYEPDGLLEFGQTYYWRIDEVNAAPDNTVFKGNTWNFTIEPFAYPVAGITATASGSFGASGPEKTIDGSGLVDDLHGVAATEMWISAGIPATIEYAFDRTYKLHELWIWNSNQSIETFVGFGAKDVVIEHSLDGENWTVLDGVGPLAQAPGLAGYAQNNAIDFGGVTAQHVRVTVNSVYGIAPQASLSEVRFFFIPTYATGPNPAPDATNVTPDTTLSWDRDGREADGHEVYVGTAANDLALAGAVSESSFSPDALDLQLGTTYTWRVDEVNEAMEPSVWTGDLWRFTTADTITVDDMESYRDEEFLEIWATWIDGFDDPGNNGAVVGAIPSLGDFSPETTIVKGGSQSLPIHFDNSGAPRSEATRTFAASQNWSMHGVHGLAVSFHGSVDNTGGRLYLKVNDTQIVYDGDPADLQLIGWHKWTIDLGVLPAATRDAVRSFTIGIDGGGSGVVYIDDIFLTP